MALFEKVWHLCLLYYITYTYTLSFHSFYRLFFMYPGNSHFTLFLRFVSGIALSLVACSSIPIVGEISSPRYRGTFFSVLQLMKLASPVSQTALGVIFFSYQAMTISAAVVSLSFFFSAYFLLESPYFLIISGKCADAKRNFKRLHPDQNEGQVDHEFDELIKSIAEDSQSSESNLWRFFKQKSILKATGLGLIIRSLHSLQGFLLTTNFLTIILPENHFVSNVYYPLIASILTLVGQILTTTIIEHFPRRELSFYSTFICSILSLFFGIVYQLSIDKYNQVWRWIVIGGIMLFVTLQGSVCLTMSEIVASELFPCRIRGQATAASVIIRAILNVISYQLFDLNMAYLGLCANFYLYWVALVASLLIIYFFQPETRGKSLSQIQKDIENSCQREQKI